MKTRFNNLFRLARLAGNEGDLLANASGGGGDAVFAIEQPDSMFIPYGEYPHRAGLQIFDQESANQILANHNSLAGKLKRAITGQSYPVYVGHPDLPGSTDADKKAYGWVETIAVENEGMRLGVKWSGPGRELVENAHYKFYSPLWWIRPAGKGHRPISLKSVGLTNQPNIPVPALANEEAASDGTAAETTEQVVPAAAETATEAEAEDAVAAETETTTESAEMVAVRADLAAAEARVVELTAAAAAENETAVALATETGARLRAVVAANVAAAVLAGRVTPAEADAKIDELLAANDMDAALAELAKAPAKMKTQSTTGNLGAAKTQLVTAANDQGAANRQARAVAVANEYEQTNPSQKAGERKRIAWERARRKNPELFG